MYKLQLVKQGYKMKGKGQFIRLLLKSKSKNKNKEKQENMKFKRNINESFNRCYNSIDSIWKKNNILCKKNDRGSGGVVLFYSILFDSILFSSILF